MKNFENRVEKSAEKSRGNLSSTADLIDRAAAAKCVPSNWLDSLLTGPDKVADFTDCPAIERLLNAVRARILALPVAVVEEQPSRDGTPSKRSSPNTKVLP